MKQQRHQTIFASSTLHFQHSESKIKFANAILRRLEREGTERLESTTSNYDNISPWLREEWNATWGEEKLRAIADAVMTESPIYISVKQEINATPEEKLQKIKQVQDSFLATGEDQSSVGSDKMTEPLPHGSIYIEKSKFPGAISKWPGYTTGEWWVQDASATLPAIALYNSLLKNPDVVKAHNDNGSDNEHGKPSSGATTPHPGVVDMCAAPGGKTAQLLSLGFPTVTAVEVSSRRAKQLRSNLERLNFQDRCNIQVVDGCKWLPPEGPETVSGILLDVPCTATGTASRRPDVLRRDSNLNSILETQYSLAVHCVDELLASGGILVYATCSLLKQESEEQVQELLQRQEGAKLRTIPFTKEEIPGFDDAIDQHGNLRVLPGCLPGKLHTCDGFFVARLQKI